MSTDGGTLALAEKFKAQVEGAQGRMHKKEQGKMMFSCLNHEMGENGDR